MTCPTTTFRLPAAVRQQLAALALVEGCSACEMVCRLVAAACAKWGIALPPAGPRPRGRPRKPRQKDTFGWTADQRSSRSARRGVLYPSSRRDRPARKG
jgi:hypothetical protein